MTFRDEVDTFLMGLIFSLRSTQTNKHHRRSSQAPSASCCVCLSLLGLLHRLHLVCCCFETEVSGNYSTEQSGHPHRNPQTDMTPPQTPPSQSKGNTRQGQTEAGRSLQASFSLSLRQDGVKWRCGTRAATSCFSCLAKVKHQERSRGTY